MDALILWLQNTSLSHTIAARTWIWPSAETIHFIGLALVIGPVGLLDLRLIGCFPQIGIGAIREMLPVAVMGFTLSLGTGLLFLIGHPEQYAYNLAWWLKVASLTIAGLNALIFEWTVAARMASLNPGEATPLTAKCIGIVSLVAWFSVVYWGRMLPFVGDAF
jgi:hypothetical protein